jgi:hypothetical protein
MDDPLAEFAPSLLRAHDAKALLQHWAGVGGVPTLREDALVEQLRGATLEECVGAPPATSRGGYPRKRHGGGGEASGTPAAPRAASAAANRTPDSWPALIHAADDWAALRPCTDEVRHGLSTPKSQRWPWRSVVIEALDLASARATPGRLLRSSHTRASDHQWRSRRVAQRRSKGIGKVTRAAASAHSERMRRMEPLSLAGTAARCTRQSVREAMLAMAFDEGLSLQTPCSGVLSS